MSMTPAQNALIRQVAQNSLIRGGGRINTGDFVIYNGTREPETRAHASLTATPAKLGVSCDDALPESLTKPLRKRSKVR